MPGRIERLLGVAVAHGHDALVPGRWGCGVNANDPDEVAGWFAAPLTGPGQFRAAAFAVPDRSADLRTLTPFAVRFGRGTTPGG